MSLCCILWQCAPQEKNILVHCMKKKKKDKGFESYSQMKAKERRPRQLQGQEYFQARTVEGSKV